MPQKKNPAQNVFISVHAAESRRLASTSRVVISFGETSNRGRERTDTRLAALQRREHAALAAKRGLAARAPGTGLEL